MIPVIETISARGSMLLPIIIYKGQAHYEGRTELVKAGDKAFFAICDKGWTSRSIGLDYFTENFEPNTSEL